MTKKHTTPDKSSIAPVSEKNEKSCFIIMPISDHPDYPPGHFKRVYEYIIKPACEIEGFLPIRADDVKSTNYIALDIVQKIIESDMAICDLSSKNPNVLYEVGIRQAFNKPVTFIKDLTTPRIFDIQGFRDVAYDQTLRIDTVDAAITELAETLTNTYHDDGGINSLISLLGINSATVTNKEIGMDTELILNAIKSLSVTPPLQKNDSIPHDFLPRFTIEELEALTVGDEVISRLRGKGKVSKLLGSERKFQVTFPTEVFIYRIDNARLFKSLSKSIS